MCSLPALVGRFGVGGIDRFLQALAVMRGQRGVVGLADFPRRKNRRSRAGVFYQQALAHRPS
jgi:hypothetical protein